MSFEFESVAAEARDETKEKALSTAAEWVAKLDADNLYKKATALYEHYKPVVSNILNNKKQDEVEASLKKAQKFDLRKLDGWNDDVKKAFMYNNYELLNSDQAWDEMCDIVKDKKTTNRSIFGGKLKPSQHKKRCMVTEDPAEKEMGVLSRLKKNVYEGKLLHRHYGPDLRTLISNNIRNDDIRSDDETQKSSASCPPGTLSSERLRDWLGFLFNNEEAKNNRKLAESIGKMLEMLQVADIQEASRGTLDKNFATISSDENLQDKYINSHPEHFYDAKRKELKRLSYKDMLQRANKDLQNEQFLRQIFTISSYDEPGSNLEGARAN